MLIGRADTSKMLAPARGDFKELKKINEGQYKRIENELNKISEYYDEIIK